MSAETRSATHAMLVVLILALAHLAAPGVGLAQLDRARALLDEAQFDRALRAYDDVLAGSLDRTQYLAALEGRAMACWATGREDRARADLLAIAEIEPTHHFPLEAPPDLTTLFESIASERAGPLALNGRWADDGALVIGIENDSASLARMIRVHLEGQEPIESPVEGSSTVQVGTGQARSAWAELVGVSGAVLATLGDASQPLMRPEVHLAASEPTEVPAPVLATPSDDADGNGDRDLWIALGVGGGALVVIGVVVAVVLGVSSGATPDASQPGAPIVTWP